MKSCGLPKRLANITFTPEFIDEGLKQLSASRLSPAAVAKKYEGFRAGKEGLYGVGGEQHSNPLVVANSDVDRVLSDLYQSLGDIGRDRLYAIVQKKYLGVSRRRVQQFLNQQELHQLLQPVRRQ